MSIGGFEKTGDPLKREPPLLWLCKLHLTPTPEDRFLPSLDEAARFRLFTLLIPLTCTRFVDPLVDLARDRPAADAVLVLEFGMVRGGDLER